MIAWGGKLGVRGLAPGKIFQDHALQIVGKRPIFGEFAMKDRGAHTNFVWGVSACVGPTKIFWTD